MRDDPCRRISAGPGREPKYPPSSRKEEDDFEIQQQLTTPYWILHSEKGRKTVSQQQIIRAWKDVEYRAGLSEAERALLPEHPAGLIELSDTDLDDVAGGGAGADLSRSWWLPCLPPGSAGHPCTQ
jgi:mersacidin/lichenicidin family type 2 lantibiotic